MDQKTVDQDIQQRTSFQIKPIQTIVCIVVVAFCIFVSSFLAYQIGKQQKKCSETTCKAEILTEQKETGSLSPSPKQRPREKEPQWEEFNKLPVVEKKDIDTSTWKEYKNDEVGIRFLYPPEWGSPRGCPAEMNCVGEKADLESCSREPDKEKCIAEKKRIPQGKIEYYSSTMADTPGYEFALSFPDMWDNGDENRTVFFELYGKSKSLGFGREEGIEHLYWSEGLSTKDFCDPEVTRYDYFLFCYTKQRNTLALRVNPFWGEYRLSYLVPLKEKKIGGISLGGEFGIKFLYERYGIGYQGEEAGDATNRAIIEKALRERKMPEDIMKNYDRYLKVFETVQTY